MPITFTDTAPYRRDSTWTLEAKMLQALNAGGGSGALTGVGAPEGVETASPGKLYVDATPPGAIYIKLTGTGNTGWSL